MAHSQNMQVISVPASADLSTKQFLFGTIGATGVAVTGAGLAADGVICDKGGSALGRPVALATAPGQVVPVMVGAAVAKGASLEVDGAGKAVTLVAGKLVAKAMAAGSGDGSIIPALLILAR
jgi:hypothetical protein